MLHFAEMNDTFTSLHSDQDLTSSTMHQMSNTVSTTGIKKLPVLYIEVHESIISVLHIIKKLSKMKPKVMPRSKRCNARICLDTLNQECLNIS